VRLSGSTLLVALFSSLPAQAQEREGGPLVLELPTSAAALSLGTAFPLSRGSSDVIFYNPSLLSHANGFGAGLERFGSRSTYANLSGATAWWRGAVGLGVQSLSYDTDASSVAAISTDASDLLSSGRTGVSELIVSGGYAQELFGVNWGVTGKLVEQRFAQFRDATLAVDLGAAIEVGDLTVGLAVQNLGPELEVGGTALELAERITLGAAFHGAPVGPLDLGAAAAVSREADGTIVPAGGLEIAYWPVNGRTFIGRVGLRRVEDSAADPVTFGAAFIGDAITIEYAYQGHDGLDGSHRFGVSWR
jgi:hypothetical protein